jgi:hypothetical protein
MWLHHFHTTKSLSLTQARMKKLLKLLASATCVANLATAQALVDYQFNDTNGGDVNDPTEVANTGSESDAAWNFGVGKVQNGNLNYGYTPSFKFTQVDVGVGTISRRKLEFVDSLTTADMSQYSFTVDFAKWDLRQNWDSNASDINKGIQISLDGNGGSATFGFTTNTGGGFRAFSQGAGSTFEQVNGGDFTTQLNRYEALGGVLQINGDLSTGLWSAQAKDGEAGAEWQTLGNGTGLTTIASITLAARSPSVGSWGGAGAGETTDPNVSGTPGDYMMIDSITLSAVPEPSSYALLAGMLTLASVMVRRRQ